MPRPTGKPSITLPVMCSLTPEAIAAGRAGLLLGLSQRATAVLATEHGYRLTFAASTDALDAIMRTIDVERRCCNHNQPTGCC